jgi:hypothetical protein
MERNRLYLHCKECAEELAKSSPGVSPKDFAKLEISVSRKGDKNLIHIDCIRHKKNVGTFTLEKLLFTITECEHCRTRIEEEKKLYH